ncbi:MAG: ribonuclease R [Pseudomonadota bacterium]
MPADPAPKSKAKKTSSDAAAAKAQIPGRDDLIAYIKAQPAGVGKREIAKAFNLKGADRVELKRMLRELAEEGVIEKGGKRFQDHDRDPSRLPPVTLLEAGAADADGELTAQPANWDPENGRAPRIVLAPARKSDPALGPGDRFLGRLEPLADDERYAYQARIIKKLGRGARRVLGLFRATGKGGRLLPVDKRQADEFEVEPGAVGGARDGELVEAEVLPGRRFGLAKARVLDRLGDPSAPKAISLIAIHEQGIPLDFPEAALGEASRAAPLTEAALTAREDLRHLDFVTIDPADARDHDDAVYAEPDGDPSNTHGWVVWVAIADVAAYVTPGSALDQAAASRGNSAYFPDRVVPMLPEALSADLCSLHEGVDRPCLAVRMRLSEDGRKIGHSFHRGVMRSRASLTYEQAQAAWEGRPDDRAAPLVDPVITPLYQAYHAAQTAREARAPLDLDLPERKVDLNAEGQVAAIRFRDRFDAHRLIEEFMILANVCAAESLEAARTPLLFRVHEEPNPEKIEALREILDSIDIPFAKGQAITTQRLNQALETAAHGEHAELVNMSVLRAQTQAYYNPENFGHFGLALRAYAHFTSPIRRYADLIVHRGLIKALGLGEDGLSLADAEGLAATAQHISMTERRAMTAERDTTDRYLAAYLADREGAQFEGRISGVQRFGLFVKLTESGADGFIPIGSLGAEYFHHDAEGARLVGERSGVELQLGMTVRVRLREATPVTGGLVFELLDLPNADGRGRAGARRTAKHKGGGRRSSGPRGGGDGAPSGRRAPKGKLARAKASRHARRGGAPSR